MEKIIVWFRQDLRLHDNPALHAAATQGSIIPVYIFDQKAAGDFALGSASTWWLQQNVQKLEKKIPLHLQQGDSVQIIKKIVQKSGVRAVYANQSFLPWQQAQDTKIAKILKSLNTDFQLFSASVLWDPEQIKKSDGTFYKVYTPFLKACLAADNPRECLPKPGKAKYVHLSGGKKISWNLDADLAKNLDKFWAPGEDAALKELKRFIKHRLAEYKHDRDYPAKQATSRLSPYLQLGVLSPHQVWWMVQDVGHEHAGKDNVRFFLKELVWREFCYHVLYHQPNMTHQNLQKKFNAMDWGWSEKKLKVWQQGQTGYPLIDAGMRELLITGYMHNRVRMVTASFLIKNLMVDWRAGAAWFLERLVDADLASNSFNWQWVAGCGYDAAPYFRIFNPVLQSKKFDPEGAYIKHWVPELAKTPKKYLHEPWKASAEVLQEFGVVLGKTYPKPMVDFVDSRAQSLKYFKKLR